MLQFELGDVNNVEPRDNLQDYQKLCDEVRKIYPYVADWMESREPLKVEDFAPCGVLLCCFVFIDTPFSKEFYAISSLVVI